MASIKKGTLVVSKLNAHTLYRVIRVNKESYDIEVIDKTQKPIIYHGQPKGMFVKYNPKVVNTLEYTDD